MVVGVSSSGSARVTDARNKKLLSVKRMSKCAIGGYGEEKRFQRCMNARVGIPYG